jgi:hypothetical protein
MLVDMDAGYHWILVGVKLGAAIDCPIVVRMAGQPLREVIV